MERFEIALYGELLCDSHSYWTLVARVKLRLDSPQPPHVLDILAVSNTFILSWSTLTIITPFWYCFVPGEANCPPVNKQISYRYSKVQQNSNFNANNINVKLQVFFWACQVKSSDSLLRSNSSTSHVTQVHTSAIGSHGSWKSASLITLHLHFYKPEPNGGFSPCKRVQQLQACSCIMSQKQVWWFYDLYNFTAQRAECGNLCAGSQM